MSESCFSLFDWICWKILLNSKTQENDFRVPYTLGKKELMIFSVYMVFDVATIADKHNLLELI